MLIKEVKTSNFGMSTNVSNYYYASVYKKVDNGRNLSERHAAAPFFYLWQET